MFSAHTERLRAEVESLVKVVRKHDQIRSLLSDTTIAPPAPNLDPLSLFRQNAPDAVAWKIYDHSAGFTRLYALFEHFVFAIVEEWLAMLPTLYADYAQLPESIRTCHRIGVGHVLTKLGGDQYQHLSEETTLQGISDGVVGKARYSFLPDAFYVDLQNLWPGVLTSLFRKIGIEDTWHWISHHRTIIKYLQDCRGNSSSAEAELKSLVQYRNSAAHGDIADVVSMEDLSKVAQFVIALSEALGQLVMWTAVNRRRTVGHVEEVGRVIHNFTRNIVGVNASGATISHEDRLIVLRDHACQYAIIRCIQDNHVTVPVLMPHADQRMALELSCPAKVGSELLRFRDPPPPDFTGEGI